MIPQRHHGTAARDESGRRPRLWIGHARGQRANGSFLHGRLWRDLTRASAQFWDSVPCESAPWRSRAEVRIARLSRWESTTEPVRPEAKPKASIAREPEPSRWLPTPQAHQ